jgi:hypothetical protein
MNMKSRRSSRETRLREHTGDHKAHIIDLDKELTGEILRVVGSGRVLLNEDVLLRFLEDNFKTISYCSACGSILPELVLIHNSRKYVFTCIEIGEDDKPVLTTDYGRFSEYVQTLNPRRTTPMRKLEAVQKEKKA